jgi:hypothetical protein
MVQPWMMLTKPIPPAENPTRKPIGFLKLKTAPPPHNIKTKPSNMQIVPKNFGSASCGGRSGEPFLGLIRTMDL